MKKTVAFLIGLLFIIPVYGKEYKLLSPNKETEVLVTFDPGISIKAYHQASPLFTLDNVSMDVQGKELHTVAGQIRKESRNTADRMIYPEIREKYGQIRDRYNALLLEFEGGFSFAIAENDAELLTNTLVYQLAPPVQIEDVSWITPGVVAFDWWGKRNIYGTNFKSGVNTETAKYFIDFCARYGFEYFLFDDGWSDQGDLLAINPGLDMEEVMDYARRKGVRIMVWAIRNTFREQEEEAWKMFEEWGISGIKFDFMQMLPDAPSDYYEEDECTQFISAIPTEWDNLEVLHAKVGEYTVLARKKDENWYAGAITNWNRKSFKINLDFLDEGADYQMKFIRDGINADTRAIDYVKQSQTVNSSQTLHIDLAPGGGWVARLIKIE